MVREHCECLSDEELDERVSKTSLDAKNGPPFHKAMIDGMRTALCPVHSHGRQEGVFQDHDLYLITGQEIGHILNCLSSEAMGQKCPVFNEQKARLLIESILSHAKLPTGPIFTRVELPVEAADG